MLEFALILPILLVLELAVLFIGLATLDAQRLTFAAQQGAQAGADNPADSCGKALEVADHVYGQKPTSEECDVQGQYITVELIHQMALTIPFAPPFVTITAHAEAVVH
jgi:Flp pilus assembly protein TadG